MSVPTIDQLAGVIPIVEMGVGSVYDDASTAVWDTALWDDAGSTWAGDEPYWYDITCHVMDIQAANGRERSLDMFDVGTATITCENNSGWADYPLSLPPVETLLTVRPGRSIRVGMSVDKKATFIWAGYIDEANPSYDAAAGSIMTFECVDAMGDAGRVELVELAAPAGAGESGTARVTRILDAGTWPAYRRALDPTGVAVRATTLGDQTVSLLQRAAESVGGQIYGDLGTDTRDPSVAFRGRDWAAYDLNDVPLGTIGNYGGGGTSIVPIPLIEDPVGSGLYQLAVVEDPAGSGLYQLADPDLDLDEDPNGSSLYQVGTLVETDAVCPNSWELMFDRAGITTRALLGRADETQRVYNDTTGGQAMFGIETYERDDLETDLDMELDWLGARILTLRNWQWMPRVAAVTITASQDHPETVNTLLQASPFTPARFICQHRDGNRVVFERVMMVTGAQHSISPDLWTARIALDAAEPYLIGGTHPAGWDEAGIALWDSATWSAPV